MTQAGVGHAILGIALPEWALALPILELPLRLHTRRALALGGPGLLKHLVGVEAAALQRLHGISAAEVEELRRLLHTLSVPEGESLELLERTRVDRLLLSAALYGNLSKAGFKSVADLLHAPPERLLAVPGLGARRVEALQAGIRRVARLPSAKLAAMVWPSSGEAFPLPRVDLVILGGVALAQSIDEEICALALGPDLRGSLLLLRRWGLVRWPLPTLDELGAEEGITRERVRQILTRHETMLRESGLRAPHSTAIVALADAAGGLVGRRELITRAQAQGIALTPLTLRTLPALSDLGMIEPFRWNAELELFATAAGVQRIESAQFREAMRGAARDVGAMLRAVGAAPELVPPAISPVPVAALVRRVRAEAMVKRVAGYVVPIPGRDSALLRGVRRILAVSSPLAVAEVRRGLVRMRRHKGWETPPLEVVGAILAADDAFVIAEESVAPRRPLEPSEVLSGSEGELLKLFETRQGVLAWSELIAGIQRAGYSAAMGSVLTRAPFVRTVAPAIYALRGRPLPGERMAEVIRQRREQDRGSMEVEELGEIVTVRYRVTTYFLQGVLSAPPVLRQHSGTWQLADPQGADWPLTLRKGFLWPLRRWMQQQGLAVGDRLIARFDTRRRTVALAAER